MNCQTNRLFSITEPQPYDILTLKEGFVSHSNLTSSLFLFFKLIMSEVLDLQKNHDNSRVPTYFTASSLSLSLTFICHIYCNECTSVSVIIN